LLLVECGNGHKAFTENNADPDGALDCPDECSLEDGTRPVTIMVMPGSVNMHHVSEG